MHLEKIPTFPPQMLLFEFGTVKYAIYELKYSRKLHVVGHNDY